MEGAARQVIDLLVIIIVLGRVRVAHREQAVTAAGDGIAQLDRHVFQQLVHALAFQLPTAMQQLARGGVGEGHALHAIATIGEQQHRHRRVLHHGVQQKFALHQRLPLFAQYIAQFGMGLHKLGEFIVAAPVHAEIEFAVAVAAGGAGECPQQRADRCGSTTQCPPHQRKQDDGGHTRHHPATVHPVRQEPRQCRRQRQYRQQPQKQGEGEGARFHWDVLTRAECRGDPCAGTAPAGSVPARRQPVR